METDGDSPPFWSPTSTAALHQRRRRRRTPTSFLSPVILILLLPILALIVIFFVISPFLSHATQFLLGPTFSVKKIWDSLNVVLVIFAIVCGVFARKKEEASVATGSSGGGQNTVSTNDDRPAETVLSSQYLNTTASVGQETEIARSSPNVYRTTTFESENQTDGSSQWYNTTPIGPEIETIRTGQWYDTSSIIPDIETVWSSQYRYNTAGVEPENQMRRSSSYPDLRQGSLWNEGDSRFWYTNVEVNIYNQSPAEAPAGSVHFDVEGLRGKEDGEDIDDKVIPVDTFEVRSTSFASPPKSTPPPSPPSEPPLIFNQRSFHENENEVENVRIVETNDADNQLKENSSPLPAPPPPPPASLKQQRSFHSVPRKKKVEKTREVKAVIADDQIKENFLAPPAPPPSPPPPPPVSSEIEQSNAKPQRKKSGTAKELTNAISSFYNQQKKKKKSKKKFAQESSSESSPPSTHPTLPPQTSPPPPPPVPPPSKVFQNLFKKSSKTKRSQYSETTDTTLPPPPPPPPPPNSIFNNMFKTGNISKRFILASSSGPPTPNENFIPKSSSGLPPSPPPPPPPPSSILTTLFKQGSRSNRFKSESSITRPPPPPPPPKHHISSKQKSKNKGYNTPTLPTESVIPQTSTPGKPPLPDKLSIYSDEYQNSGSQSPLVTNPSPPPLPPFKMPEFEFVASGDFVRIRSSASNSWCSSPGLEDVTDGYSDQMDGSDMIGPSVYCPSPDVNVKADTFISRLKDEWRLEKMNSISKIGPKPKPK